MFRIRLHGRGGQGIKTAGRMLGTAFFRAGFEVQDAPRYGAERRGAPIFAYVRADRRPIQERGVIRRPDLVIVADDTLMTVSGAEVLAGVAAHTVLLLASQVPPDLWRERLRTPGPVLTLPTAPAADPLPHRFLGAACAGAAAGLVGLIPREALARAVEEELAAFSAAVVGQNREQALQAFDGMSRHSGCVTEGPEAGAEAYAQPNWLDLPPESVEFSAPAIFTPATSRLVPTGLWRTVRPVLDRARCKRCAWICSTLCPDGVISVDQEGYPVIDYEHCKGCLICLANCPSHALHAVPEEETGEKVGGRGQGPTAPSPSPKPPSPTP